MLQAQASGLDDGLYHLLGERAEPAGPDAVTLPVPATPSPSAKLEKDEERDPLEEGAGVPYQAWEGEEEEEFEEDPLWESSPDAGPEDDLLRLRTHPEPPYDYSETMIFDVDGVAMDVPTVIINLQSADDEFDNWTSGQWLDYFDRQERKLLHLRDRFQRIFNERQGMSPSESLADRKA